MLTFDEQGSDKSRVWVSEFQPAVNGLTVSWPAWTLYVQGQSYLVPGDSFALADMSVPQVIRLWVIPDAASGYLHLDVYPDDGEHDAVTPDPFHGVGNLLLLWGWLEAKASEPDLNMLRHIPPPSEQGGAATAMEE